MAICNVVPQIKVTVNVDGNEAVEYNDDEGIQDDNKFSKGLNTVAKYIESQDDATFSICVSVDPSYTFEPRGHVLACTVHIDGKRICTHLIGKHDLSTEFSGCKRLPEDGFTWKMQTFKFASISTVEDASEARIEEDSKTAMSLGLIEVHIDRAVLTGGVLPTHPQKKQKASIAQLAEKALKGRAFSHVATFGTDIDIPTPKLFGVQKLDQGTGLTAFQFKYRSRDSLQKLMIIPRTPRPELAEEEIENPPAIISHARRQLLQDKGKPIKEMSGMVIKKEPEVYDLTGDVPVYKRKRKHAETIDLTDD